MRNPIIKISLLLIINLSLCTRGTAQVNQLDSLEKILKTDIDDSLKLKTLYRLASSYNDIDKSILYSKQLLAFCEITKEDLYEGVAYNLLGMNYLNKDYSLDTVIHTFEKGMEKAVIVDNARLKAVISNGMAMTYDKFGQKDKALLLYQQSYTFFDKSGYKNYAIRCLGNIALVLKNDGDLETAKKYYFKAIEIAKTLNDSAMVSQLGHNVGSIYFKQNKIDSALTLYERSVEVNKAVDDKYFTALSLAGIGRIYNYKKQYKIASSYLIESYELASKIKDTYCIGSALGGLCDNYYQQKQYLKTINSANEALMVLGEHGDILTRTSFYKHLSNSYEAQGNYQLAFENQEAYYTFSDSLYGIEKSKQINGLKIQYEVAQKETENQLLKTQQETAERTIKNRGYIAGGLITALIFAIGWGTTFYRSNRQKRKHNIELTATVDKRTNELQVANESLAKTNEELEQANYELRTFNYIASHDIKEPIRVIGGYAGLAFRKLPTDLKESLGEYFDGIKRSTIQLYTLIEDFARYTTLSKGEIIEKQTVDLNELTISVVDNLQETTKKHNGQVNISDLPIIESSNSLLFSALKNVIENGLKYNKSENPTVEVSYQKTETHHEIIVSDNGIGIKKEYQEKIFEMFKRLHNRGAYEGSGIGLAIVKLSVDKLGGTVNLESEVGKGSRFVIQLPIR